ncbi:MAG: AraC family transcriptional regulator [Bacteroidota bacterium]
MPTSTVIIVILLCIGALQGMVYGVLYWKSRGPNTYANRFLAAILFFLSYRLGKEVMLLFGIGKYDIWYHWMIDFNWVYGALIFFYVKAQVQPSFRLRVGDLGHFLPLFIQILISNFVRIQNFYWDGTKESISWLGYWAYVYWMNYPSVPLVASCLIVMYTYKAEATLGHTSENMEMLPTKAAWLRKVIFSFRIYFMIVLGILLIDLAFFDQEFRSAYYYFTRYYYYPLYIGVALLTYWLGLAGYSKKDEVGLKIKAVISPQEQDQMAALGQRLRQLMKEEKVYQNPELNLTTLAEKLEVKPYLLSRCLKGEFGNLV